MTEKLETIAFNTAPTPQACVIWLHGLGASADNFVPMVSQLQLPQRLAVRFVFPQAPVQPVTINLKHSMPAWYDVFGLALTSKQDEAGIRRAEAQLRQLIQSEIAAGISSDKIILAGFSQGGALVLHTALRYSQRLAGVIALSAYLPLADLLADEINNANRYLPVLLAHGNADSVLPQAASEMSRAYLEKLGCSVTFKTYNMAHQVCDEEIIDIAIWMQQVL